MRSLAACQLYTFVDTAYLNGRDPVEVAAELCTGGSDIIQLRAKGMDAAAVRSMAEGILPIIQNAGVLFVVNDYPEIARDLGVFGHLGQEDFFDAGYRHISELPTQKIGLSTHSPEQAESAIAAGPSYIAIGPVYATGTKPTATPVTLEYVRWAARAVKIPWFAIGGINLDTVEAVLAAGAQRICVVSAILKAESISKACLAFRQRLPSAALQEKI